MYEPTKRWIFILIISHLMTLWFVLLLKSTSKGKINELKNWIINCSKHLSTRKPSKGSVRVTINTSLWNYKCLKFYVIQDLWQDKKLSSETELKREITREKSITNMCLKVYKTPKHQKNKPFYQYKNKQIFKDFLFLIKDIPHHENVINGYNQRVMQKIYMYFIRHI